MIYSVMSSLASPFISLTNGCFDNVSNYIVRKHTGVQKNAVDHGLKVHMFNATTSLLVGIVVLGYYRKIAMIVTVALAVMLYLVRQMLGATISPIEVSKEPLEDIKKETLARVFPERQTPAQSLHDIGIFGIVILKRTYYPLSKMMGLLLTRSP